MTFHMIWLVYDFPRTDEVVYRVISKSTAVLHYLALPAERRRSFSNAELSVVVVNFSLKIFISQKLLDNIFSSLAGWTGKDGSPSPTLGTIIKKSYDGSSVLSTSLGSKC